MCHALLGAIDCRSVFPCYVVFCCLLLCVVVCGVLICFGMYCCVFGVRVCMLVRVARCCVLLCNVVC